MAAPKREPLEFDDFDPGLTVRTDRDSIRVLYYPREELREGLIVAITKGSFAGLEGHVYKIEGDSVTVRQGWPNEWAGR